MAANVTSGFFSEALFDIIGLLPEFKVIFLRGKYFREIFNKNHQLIKKLNPTIVNISKYGDRPGTIASKSTGKVNTSQKKDWSRELSKLVSEIMIMNNTSWVGWTGPALVTKAGVKGGIVCRNESYKPIVIHENQPIGTWTQVRITSAEKTHLYAEVV